MPDSVEDDTPGLGLNIQYAPNYIQHMMFLDEESKEILGKMLHQSDLQGRIQTLASRLEEVEHLLRCVPSSAGFIKGRIDTYFQKRREGDESEG